jgi:hypothetical protein
MIVGILLQVALMNLCVILWWFAGPGLKQRLGRVLYFFEAEDRELWDLRYCRCDIGVILYVPIFAPQDPLSVFLENLGWFVKTKLAFLYHESAVAAIPRSRFSRIVVFLRQWARLIMACIVCSVGRCPNGSSSMRFRFQSGHGCTLFRTQSILFF